VLRLLLHRGHFCLDSFGHVSLGMLVQVVFPRESLPALVAGEIFVPRVDDVVAGEVFVALEALHADGAHKRTLCRMAPFVLVQVLFPLQSGTALFTLETALKFVSAHVLIQFVSRI